MPSFFGFNANLIKKTTVLAHGSLWTGLKGYRLLLEVGYVLFLEVGRCYPPSRSTRRASAKPTFGRVGAVHQRSLLIRISKKVVFHSLKAMSSWLAVPRRATVNKYQVKYSERERRAIFSNYQVV